MIAARMSPEASRVHVLGTRLSEDSTKLERDAGLSTIVLQSFRSQDASLPRPIPPFLK